MAGPRSRRIASRRGRSLRPTGAFTSPLRLAAGDAPGRAHARSTLSRSARRLRRTGRLRWRSRAIGPLFPKSRLDGHSATRRGNEGRLSVGQGPLKGPTLSAGPTLAVAEMLSQPLPAVDGHEVILRRGVTSLILLIERFENSHVTRRIVLGRVLEKRGDVAHSLTDVEIAPWAGDWLVVCTPRPGGELQDANHLATRLGLGDRAHEINS